MQLAVHYNPQTAALLDSGQVQFDLFKCPAWPDLITEVTARYRAYVHFPLRTHTGSGEPVDTESNQPPDWGKVEGLLAQTDTPFVNVHLGALVEDYPDIPPESTAPEHIERVVGDMVRDVLAVVGRFGAAKVIVENDHPSQGRYLRISYLPETIRRVVEASGCGLLFDLSHARLAARALGMDAREYTGRLPVQHTRELHLTGIGPFDAPWVERLRRAQIDEALVQRFAGQTVDHLPMHDDDWPITTWALAKAHSGDLGQPQIAAFEVGGVGPLWHAITDPAALARDLPRLHALVHRT